MFDAHWPAVPRDWVPRWNGEKVAALASSIATGYFTGNRLDHRVTSGN